MNAGGRRQPGGGDSGAALHAEPASAGAGAPIIDRVQKAVEEFRRTAPAVTQALILITAISWLIHLLSILPRYALECIPHFILQEKFELYRLVTSLLVNRDLFTTGWACLLLAQYGRTVEESIGSAVTVWLAVGVFTLLVNISYCFVQVVLASAVIGDGVSARPADERQTKIDGEESSPSSSSSSFMIMYWEAPGIWSAVLGMVTVESCRAARYQPHRTFCNCFTVPTQRYPLCLLAMAVLLTWSQRSSIMTLSIATGLGYFIGLNHHQDSGSIGGLLTAPAYLVAYLDAHCRGSPGWISTTASTGSAAWMHEREVKLRVYICWE
jgi:membrane associated rhomboid family serine protease